MKSYVLKIKCCMSKTATEAFTERKSAKAINLRVQHKLPLVDDF